jgi:hypothetical protein
VLPAAAVGAAATPSDMNEVRFLRCGKENLSYILVWALRLDGNAPRYQEMGDMRVGLSLMAFILVTLKKKLATERY